MKKYIIIISILLFIGAGVLVYLYIDSYKIKVDNRYVVAKKDIILEIYEDYVFSDFIEITDGKLLGFKWFGTGKLGKDKAEILYLNKHNRKRKAYVDYEVIDDVSPIILGGSSKTILKGDKSPIEYLLFSADNYDSNPKREIIGECDINNIGQYNLALKVTDSSNNVTSKDFVLNVIESFPISIPSNTRTNYEDIFNTHKNENNKIGLDISKYQGEVDFNKLSENKVEFVMLRVGYQTDFNGTSEIDPYFYNNMEKLKGLNIPVGVYFHSYATTTKEAHEQALWVLEKIKDYDISLPIVFDFESWDKFSSLKLSLHDINNISRTFLSTIKSNGYQAMNYSSKFYLENIWDISEYPVWLANYTSKTEYAGDYVMWQLCNNGKIDGINGAVDIDILYSLDIIRK